MLGMHRNRGLPLVVIRPGVLFGPGRPLVTGRVGLTVGNVSLQMGGRRQVPLCFVDNCAAAVAAAVDAPGIDGMCFNIVDDELPTADELVGCTGRRGRRSHGSGCRRGLWGHSRMPAGGVRGGLAGCGRR